jgi:hypothetical protein
VLESGSIDNLVMVLFQYGISVQEFSNKIAEIEREAHFVLTLFRKCGLVVFVVWKG